MLYYLHFTIPLHPQTKTLEEKVLRSQTMSLVPNIILIILSFIVIITDLLNYERKLLDPISIPLFSNTHKEIAKLPSQRYRPNTTIPMLPTQCYLPNTTIPMLPP